MRTSSLIIGALIACLTSPARADDTDTGGEVVWAVSEVPLRTRPGEKAPVVENADAGDQLDVLGNRGRWLHVRHGKRVGWVTRTQVEKRQADDARKRSERTGFSGKRVRDSVKVTVEIDRVRGFDDPRTKANSVLDLVRGDVVTVLGRGHAGWILVEHEGDGVGWIPESAVSDAGHFAGDPRNAPDETAKAKPAATATAAAAAPARPAQTRVIGSLLATAGAQTFQMVQTGAAETQSIATGAVATLAAGAHVRVGGGIWVGIATTAELSSADLTYFGGAEESAAIPSRTIAVDAAGEVRFGRARYIAARAGVHYATFSVDSDRTEAMLLGERIGGPIVGVAGGLPFARRFAITAGIDVMPAGTQKLSEQPAGVLYGTAVRGGWARTTLTMRLPAHVVAALAYRGGFVSTELTDGAAMTATRTDQSHVLAAGIGVSW